MKRIKLAVVALAATAATAAAFATETISYSYDAKGRLVRTVHSGTVNNGLTSTFGYDKAGNRTAKGVSGSPN